MIKLWLAFIIFAVLIHFGITAWRNMEGKEQLAFDATLSRPWLRHVQQRPFQGNVDQLGLTFTFRCHQFGGRVKSCPPEKPSLAGDHRTHLSREVSATGLPDTDSHIPRSLLRLTAKTTPPPPSDSGMT